MYSLGVHQPQRDVAVGLRSVPPALPVPRPLRAVPRRAVPPRADRVLRRLPRDAGAPILYTIYNITYSYLAAYYTLLQSIQLLLSRVLPHCSSYFHIKFHQKWFSLVVKMKQTLPSHL